MKENNYFKKKRGHTSLYYSCELMESGQNSLKRNFQHQELQTTLYLFYYSNMFLAIPFFLSLASSLPTDLDFHVFKKKKFSTRKAMTHNFKNCHFDMNYRQCFVLAVLSMLADQYAV